jgi:EAL domain-containing protein (putative c-di-GMP-specific phosphodiesterase class I)
MRAHVGLVEFPKDGDRLADLIRRATLSARRATRWVVAEALDAQVGWRDRGIHLPVSVNVSAKNLADPGLPGWVFEALDVRHLPASCLTVEVTESVVTDADQARAVLGPLRDHGVRISMDDFGTGYTSLSALPGLPLDKLKIDQGFVRHSLALPADDAIVATTCDFGHRLGLTVVAEGVEDADIELRLVAHGVDLLQGYHLAQPLSEGVLISLVDSSTRRLVDSSTRLPQLQPDRPDAGAPELHRRSSQTSVASGSIPGTVGGADCRHDRPGVYCIRIAPGRSRCRQPGAGWRDLARRAGSTINGSRL